ncbi:MAG: AIR synthase-related protein [Fidelibacterota bacterium]
MEQILAALNRTPTELEKVFLKAMLNSVRRQNPFPGLGQQKPAVLSIPPAGDLRLTLAVECKQALVPTSIQRECARYGITNRLVLKTPWATFAAGLFSSADGNQISLKAGNRIFFLNQNRNLQVIIAEIIARPWFRKTCVVNPYGLGAAYLDCLKDENLGLMLHVDDPAELKRIYSRKVKGLLVIIQEGFEQTLAEICQGEGITPEFLGTIVEKEHFILQQGKRQLFSLPRTILPEMENNSTLFSNKPYQVATPSGIPEIEEPQHYAEILDRLQKAKEQDQHESIFYVNQEFSWPSKRGGNSQLHLTLLSGSRPYLCSLDPYKGGSSTVALVARELVCRGVNPLGVVAVIHGQNWQGDEQQARLMAMVQGCREACAALQLPLLDITVTEKETKNVFCEAAVVGTSGREPIPCVFREAGEFVSMLGSHRGELGGSLYLRVMHDFPDGPIPTLDLPMEKRLHEALLQGFQTGLLKSAANVGSGGLGVTLLTCLQRSPDETGARIFLSRKLRNNEIVFGETQGLVLITLGEDDLMEFERICMSVGVPSTTIGRVTDDGQLKFNDLFTVNVKEVFSED